MTCLDCDKKITPGAKRCRAHANAYRNAQPEMREAARKAMVAKQAAGIKRNDALMAENLRLFYANNPEALEQLRERGARGRAAAHNPRSIALRGANASRTRQAQRAKRLEWCPADRRAEFHRLARSFTVAEARRIIEADEIARVRRAMK